MHYFTSWFFNIAPADFNPRGSLFQFVFLGFTFSVVRVFRG